MRNVETSSARHGELFTFEYDWSSFDVLYANTTGAGKNFERQGDTGVTLMRRRDEDGWIDLNNKVCFMNVKIYRAKTAGNPIARYANSKAARAQ